MGEKTSRAGAEIPGIALVAAHGEEALFAEYAALRPLPASAETEIVLDGAVYLCRRVPVGFAGMELVSLVRRDTLFADVNAYRLGITVALGATGALIAAFIFALLRLINHPVYKLVEAFEQMQAGRLDIRIDYKGNDEFGILYRQFNAMTARLRQLIDENYRSKLYVQQAQLKQLHSQVNPHFLHNSFLNISAMAQLQDYEGIQEMTTKLSMFYSYITHNRADTTTLQKEDEFARLYADIQKIRFGDKVEIAIQPLPEALKNAPIPRFTLQTLLENACKYALPTRESDSAIRVSYEEIAGGYRAIVDDNGLAFSEEKLSALNAIMAGDDPADNGTGLVNIRQRLRLLWGENGTIAIERAPIGGMRVVLCVRADCAPAQD